ncbi:MAG: NUDIX domain-containing protein [Candidatus Woesearchaeota archaeon]|jgi:dATP pyrophosphohydrolase|nr:NUDIX domain-containing protein [Candidatus Woesearchaeota archaeon]
MSNKRIQLEAIVYRKKKDEYEFLLLKRIPSKGHFWQPICGKMEDSDKNVLDGCYREIKEETSIDKKNIIRVIDNVHYFEMNRHYLTREVMPTIKEYVLAFEVDTNTVINIENNIYPEHEEYKWVTLEEALDLLKWENNKEAFSKLFENLKDK